MATYYKALKLIGVYNVVLIVGLHLLQMVILVPD